MTESSLFWIMKKLLTTVLWRSLVVEITILKKMVKSFCERRSNNPLTTERLIVLFLKKKVGGAVIKVDGEKGSLDLLFVSLDAHGKGVGYATWCQIEKLHPEVKIWETMTRYFE